MLKFILLAALLASGVTFAGGFSAVEYSNRDGVNGNSDATAIKLTVGTSITDNLAADVSLRQKQDSSDKLKDNRLEGGLTFSAPSTLGLTPYLRTAVGEKYTTSTNYTYYSVEPGVKYAVTDSLSVKAGYRYRNAFSDTNADQTRAWRVGAEYALNKTYSLGLGYDQVRGDSEYNAINASVRMKF
jgi:opacity protein-like surface antigen